MIPTPPTLAGLFFCLASAEGAGLLFLTCCNTQKYKRLQRVLCRSCNYTTSTAKQRTGLYRGVSCNLPHSTAANTRPTHAAIIPPAPRWSAHTRRTLYSSAQPSYYNKVYKGAGGRPCYGSVPTRRGLDASSARRLAIWHRVSSQGAAGGAEQLTATAAFLFGLSPDS